MPNYREDLNRVGRVTTVQALADKKDREKTAAVSAAVAAQAAADATAQAQAVSDAVAAQAAADATALTQAVADERARAVAILQLPETETHLAIAIQAVSDGTSAEDAQALMQA